MKKITVILFAVFMSVVGFAGTVQAAETPTEIKISWSDYVYWYFYKMAEDRGIVSDIERKHNVRFVLTKGKYEGTLQEFTTGHTDVVTTTLMDAWKASLVRKGIFILPGDSSHDNDLILSTECDSMEDCIKQDVVWNYANDSVSDALVFACLKPFDVDIRSIRSNNIAESDIVTLHARGKATSSVWKPFASEIKNPVRICGSADFPGFIIDGLLVAADMEENEKKAVVDLHYTATAALNGPDGETVMRHLAYLAALDVPSFKDNLATTFRLDNPADAVDFVNSADFEVTMRGMTRDWILSTGVSANELDSMGVSLPGGKTIGNVDNVRLTIDDAYIKMAADGKL